MREVKIYGPDTAASTPGALAAGYSLTLGGPTTGSAFAGLLGEAFVAPRALSRAELGLAIHGLAGYDGTEPTGDHDRWYTLDGDLNSYHDRADRRRAAAEHEAQAVVDSTVGELVVPNLVEAALSPLNLARSCGSSGNQACTVAASSEYSASYAAALANNGIYNDIHETNSETNPWWRVDFQTPKYVSFAKIWLCDYCDDRLVGFELWIGDSSTYNGVGNTQCSSGFTFQLSAASQEISPSCVGYGRYFFVVVPGSSKRININEVEVFAAAVYAPAPARRLYALEVAAAQTLDAPVADAFNWASAWTVAAWLRLASGATNVLTLVDGTPATAAVAGVDGVAAGAWTHVALTYDGSAADAQLHVNGGAGTAVPLGSLATSTSPGGSVRITGAAVDDLRVYASDLSGSLAQAGAPAAASAFVPAACTDSLPIGFDATLSNACYVKYAGTGGNPTSSTTPAQGACDADHGYFYILQDCLVALGYSAGITDLAVQHYRGSSLLNNAQKIKWWWRQDTDWTTIGSNNDHNAFSGNTDYLIQGQTKDGSTDQVVVRANDHFIIPPAGGV